MDGFETDLWATGLWDGAADFFRLVDDSPSLRARERELGERVEAALSRELTAQTGAGPDDPMPGLVAGVVVGSRRAVLVRARQRMLGGEAFETVRAWAEEAYRRAFDLVENGVPADYGVRRD
ncbi:hypothetical protein [Cryptosporangium sp. NPDC051539]|uniref:hypothetical protein n=1 Tax=Cryptosporangium sp. NPDC051539 TaxID=3363962 RepID=UPI0037B6B54A